MVHQDLSEEAVNLLKQNKKIVDGRLETFSDVIVRKFSKEKTKRDNV